MSRRLIARSPDLKRLQDEGYDVRITGNYLVIRHVPYVTAQRGIKFGILVSTLHLAGDVTQKPDTHVVYFAGEHPCRQDGSELAQIKHSSNPQQLVIDLFVDHQFSAKPEGGYTDYYHKMTTYVAAISGHAQALDPSVTAQIYPVIETDEDEGVFQYLDTATSRADIGLAARKLEVAQIAIVGLGGTGSYVLDLVAKTPVRAIHLFDRDTFSSHNAFRSPGAASIEELREQPKKVDYLKAHYARMHRGIVAHDCFIDPTNVELLRGMDYVFLCLDNGETKEVIVRSLENNGVPFIDVGMGLHLVDGSLIGVLRVTTSTPDKRDHVWAKQRIPFSGGGDNDYDRNIQIADLNALNAALAVVKWKKLCGFYLDLDQEHHTTYTVDGNLVLNEDRP